MSQKKKAKEDIAMQEYLNTTDIMNLLGITWRKAKRTFDKADEIDSFMDFRVEPNRVRIETVEKLAQKKLKKVSN